LDTADAEWRSVTTAISSVRTFTAFSNPSVFYASLFEVGIFFLKILKTEQILSALTFSALGNSALAYASLAHCLVLCGHLFLPLDLVLCHRQIDWSTILIPGSQLPLTYANMQEFAAQSCDAVPIS